MNNRVWIFTAERPLRDSEESLSCSEIQSFLAGWNAHGTSLVSSFEIRYHQMIIIKADEQQFSASGCSIDKLMRCIQQLERQIGVSLLNRQLIAFLKGDKFFLHPAAQTTELIQQKILSDDSMVFDLSVSNENELQEKFQLALRDTWLKKYLKINETLSN